MDKEKKIREEVQKTLHAFGNIKNIEGNPFLFTRIKANLDVHSGRKNVFGLSGPSFLKKALVGFLLVLNAVSVFFYLQNSNNVNDSREENISSLAKEYSLVVDRDYLNSSFGEE